MLNVGMRLHELFENLRTEGTADTLNHLQHHRFELS